MSLLHHLNSDPTCRLDQYLSHEILHPEAAGDPLVGFHLVEESKKLFEAALKKLKSTFSIHSLIPDPFLHTLSYLTPVDRKIAHLVCRHWNKSLERIALEEKNVEMMKRFEPLRKTLGLLREHFSVHSHITPMCNGFIAQVLRGILPDRKDVTSVNEVKRLEHKAQSEIGNLLLLLDEEELAVFLQFSNFSRDNPLAQLLDFIIKCVPLYREKGNTSDDIHSLCTLVDCHPAFPLDDQDEIVKELQGRIEKEAQEDNPLRAAQLATLYSEILPQKTSTQVDFLEALSWLLIKRGFFIPGRQIATLSIQARPNYSFRTCQIARKIQAEALKETQNGNPTQAVQWATLYFQIPPQKDATKAAHLAAMNWILIDRGFFVQGMQMMTLCIQAYSDPLVKVRAIMGLHKKLSTHRGAKATAEQLSQVPEFYCRTVIESEKQEWGLRTCLTIAQECILMGQDNHVFAKSQEALYSIGLRLIDLMATDALGIYKMDPLTPNIDLKFPPKTVEIFKKIGCAFVEKGFFNEAVDIAVICAKTVVKSVQKTQAIREIGAALIKKQGASEQVLQITEICCKMATKADVEDWMQALFDMISIADKAGNSALAS